MDRVGSQQRTRGDIAKCPPIIVTHIVAHIGERMSIDIRVELRRFAAQALQDECDTMIERCDDMMLFVDSPSVHKIRRDLLAARKVSEYIIEYAHVL